MWLKVSVHCNYEGWGMLGSCIQLKLVLLILSLKRSGCASWLSKCPLHCTLMGKRNNNEAYKVMFCLSVPPPGDLSPRYCPRQCEAGLAGVWWPHLRSASTTGAHIRPLSTLSTVYTPLPLSLLFSYLPSSSYTQHFTGGRSLLPSDAILLIIYISTTHLPYLIQNWSLLLSKTHCHTTCFSHNLL